MRINRFVAQASGLSRRQADQAIAERRVKHDDRVAELGETVSASGRVTLDGRVLHFGPRRTVVFNKPPGYVTSRGRQGSTATIYALLPSELHDLKPVGRLDRDSSGLLVLTNDGDLAQKLQHPSHKKLKRYQVVLDRPLDLDDIKRLKGGVRLKDGVSKLKIKTSRRPEQVEVSLEEGRNRQIRRTFGALGYTVRKLHRISIGEISIGRLDAGKWRLLETEHTRVKRQ